MSAVTSENRRSATAATDLIIRDAADIDVPAVVSIYNAAIATRVATAQFESISTDEGHRWLKQHRPDEYPFWVAEIDGRVAGWLSLKPFLPRCAYRGTAEISVYVDEKSRRRGVAFRLLQQAIASAPSLGINALVGLMYGHNQPSLSLFEQAGFERWGELPGIARVGNTERDLIVVGRHCPARQNTVARGMPSADVLHRYTYKDCLMLMHTLMQYRQEPIHSVLLKIRDKYSMLHLDVLLLIYHFAKACSGCILELGAFVGGATMAAAFGVRDSGVPKKLITVEPGGSVKHKRLGTRNTLRDLKRNLAREGVSDMVTLITGRSFDRATISAIHQALGSDEIGLLIVDADAGKRRDIECYRDRLVDNCWMVIDDYCGAESNIKSAPSRADIDALVSERSLEVLGFYGWSTCIARWRGGSVSSPP